MNMSADTKEFERAMNALTISSTELMHVAGAGSAVMKTTQKILVPKDTHATELSILEEFFPGDKIVDIEVGPRTDYSPYIEFGTSNPNYPIQPFVVPSAFGKNKVNVLKAVANAFMQLVMDKWKT
jgi:hypothetical protein